MIFTRCPISDFKSRKIVVCICKEIDLLLNHCSFTVMIMKNLFVSCSNTRRGIENRNPKYRPKWQN
jgi:hypothetical protein